ncbi:MAG: MMPL family transporter [Lachnospiraceae bacterium]|nr:MMPL family transporter [Lachnospiraceae bacterium]
MPKYSVKRPFTVVVGVVMLLILGFVSFTRMTTDLLPTIDLPYVMVITAYPGAAPERVEANVTEPLESGLGTVNGVKTVMSTSSENYSLVFLEFEDDTNMDGAMVKLSTALGMVELPDTAAKPMLMEISPDMLPTMVVSVDYEGKDIYELSEFAEEVVVPYLERQNGTASVEEAGLVEQSVEVRLDPERIDEINDKLLAQVYEKLDEAKQELEEGRAKLDEAKQQMEEGKAELEAQQNEASSQLAESSKMLNEALATKAAYEAQLASLTASKAALEAERSAYDSAMQGIYQQLNDALERFRNQMQSESYYNKVLAETITEITGNTEVTPETAKEVLAGLDDATRQAVETAVEIRIQADLLTAPGDIADLIAHPEKQEELIAWLLGSGDGELAGQLTPENLQAIYQVVLRVSQIDAELANLNTEIMVSQTVLNQVGGAVSAALDNYTALEQGKITAAAGFGAAAAQIASGEETLAGTEAQLDEAQRSYEDARAAAIENANLDTLLNLETLSGILLAENFSMPAGYIQEDAAQYILKVGDEYEDMDQLGEMLLCTLDGIGDVRLKDVAWITLIDNAGESYTKVNGNVAVALTITKASTAGTSSVSKTCNAAIRELEEQYEGLHITPLMDQGDYIELIVDSVMSNLIWGALLAVLVLVFFLKDPKPTIVVAFSIPFSVLFAVVLMYFSHITLNVISLSGLALGVGMLVDNSIVVIENIYRLRNKGIPAARAAVLGANQMAGAIFSSTLTTVCVFLPIVFMEGMTRQLFQDMGLTIAYSLFASLVIALTLVPCMGATVLKECKEKKHRWFDAALNGYEKLLRFCLRFKIVPLAVSVLLLVFSIREITRIGIVLLPDMSGNQVSITVTAPEGAEREEAYVLADDAMNRILSVEGVQTVGAMSGGGMMSMTDSGGSDNRFSFYVLLDEAAAKQSTQVISEIEKSLAGIEGEAEIQASGMSQMSELMGNGMELTITGPGLETLAKIARDMKDLLGRIGGFEEITDGQEEADSQIIIHVDKDKAMSFGLTVAQIYTELAEALKTESEATTLNIDTDSYRVTVVDDSKRLTVKNLMDYEFETTTQDENGESVKEIHKLSEFAGKEEAEGIASISRENQTRYMSVSARTTEGYNTVLLSRQVESLLADYEVPAGYTVEIAGETESINSMLRDMVLMILLAVAFIYLIMVAQFQSLLSPFIVVFTMPLAFTGGLLALLLAREPLSMVGMMGFLILAGVVVNNGIVFVDYVNQLRLEGAPKKEALIEAGRTRMRPILMTALTTILAMSTMALSNDEAAAIGKGMAIVTIGGLTYATLMTLIIVPVLYDILFRKELKKVDLGDESNLLEE